MRVASSIVLPALLVLLASMGGCADKLRVPPRDETATISEELRERVHRHETSLQRDGLAKTNPDLERTLAEIAREYGEQSIAVPQSITEAGLMIISETGQYSDAIPYMARALVASEAVYGRVHRETAFALHDYALTQIYAKPGEYVPAATPLLERALAVRIAVLGGDSLETAGSKREVARQLLAKCRSRPPCLSADPLLERAELLAERALEVIRTGEKGSNIASAQETFDEIERARGKAVVTQRDSSEKSASTCGKSSGREEIDDLSWVRADVKLYRLTPDFEFSVGGFDGRPWKRIAKHELEVESMPELSQSVDRRWIAYRGVIAGTTTQELWLFDKLTQTERRVAIMPKYHTNSLEFSPNGRTLAYFSSYDERWTGKQGMGLYLVDAQSGTNTFAGYPAATAIGPLLGFGSVVWSADGGSVLLHLVGHPSNHFTREFHRFDASTRTFHKIDGNYDQSVRNGEEFVERGSVIAQHENRQFSTQAWYRELRSPSGVWRAHVDQEHRLLASRNGRAETLVEIGGYNDCEGETIGITGWVKDRYLVFRTESRQVIFDPVTSRRALLFREDDANAYTW